MLGCARSLPGHGTAGISRSRIQQLIRAGFVRLNGAIIRPNELVRTGDQIELTNPPTEKIETETGSDSIGDSIRR